MIQSGNILSILCELNTQEGSLNHYKANEFALLTLGGLQLRQSTHYQHGEEKLLRKFFGAIKALKGAHEDDV